MVKVNGGFQFRATGKDDMKNCAIFFIGEVDEIISLTLRDIKLKSGKCDENDGEYLKVKHILSTINLQLKVYDGWNVNGILIPHSEPILSSQETNFCQVKSFEATQNAAMISFRVRKGSSFVIEHITNTATEGTYYFYGPDWCILV